MGLRTGNPRGRPKGSPNKATTERQAEVTASGLTPLDFMLTALRDETKDFGTRFEAAKAAAPYVHPKLSTVQMEATVHADVSDEPDEPTVDEWQTEASPYVQ